MCEGNAMRSPMAEAFFNEFTGSNQAISAGAAPFPVGGGAFPEVNAAMKELGLSLDGHASQKITPEIVEWADIVIGFPTPMMPDYVKNSPKYHHWDIADPYYAPEDGTDYIRLARDKIETRVKEMLRDAYSD